MSKPEAAVRSTSRVGFVEGSALVLACLVVAPFARATPNLTPFRLTGWSDKIVVSNVAGSTSTHAVDTVPLKPTDTLYVNFAVINAGNTATTARFEARLSVDGVVASTSFWADPPVLPNNRVYWTDVRIGSFSPGIHTVTVVFDPTGVIGESNEADNSYTRSFTVASTGGLRHGARLELVPRPSLLVPIGEHFGGSSGALTFEVAPGPYPCTIHEPCIWNDVEQARGGNPPYHYAVGSFAEGAPPFGMTVDVFNGSVHGTPTVSNTYHFDVCVWDTVNASVCRPTSITVSDVVTSIAPTNRSFSQNGGGGSVTVTASSLLFWRATSNDAWITVTYVSSSSGNGTVNYSVAANNTGAKRVGTVTIAGLTFTVNQDGPSNLPDLSPAIPSGWSDAIVVTKSAGATFPSAVDSTSLSATDTLFVSWAVSNFGTADATSVFQTTLYLDGAAVASWDDTPPLSGFTGAGYDILNVLNYSIGSLTAGLHTLKISADSSDTVTESDESNNTYTKTIAVTATGGGGSSFAGTYSGSYIGTSTCPNAPGGSLVFVVDAGGNISTKSPGSGSGSVSDTGSATFVGSPNGPGDACDFDGTFVVTGSGAIQASGTWGPCNDYCTPFGLASGTWSASKQ